MTKNVLMLVFTIALTGCASTSTYNVTPQPAGDFSGVWVHQDKSFASTEMIAFYPDGSGVYCFTLPTWTKPRVKDVAYTGDSFVIHATSTIEDITPASFVADGKVFNKKARPPAQCLEYVDTSSL